MQTNTLPLLLYRLFILRLTSTHGIERRLPSPPTTTTTTVALEAGMALRCTNDGCTTLSPCLRGPTVLGDGLLVKRYTLHIQQPQKATNVYLLQRERFHARY